VLNQKQHSTTCSTFDFGLSVSYAEKKFQHTPMYRMGTKTFQIWLYECYGISVFRKDGTPFPYKSDGKWGVYQIEDEELATIFKLKYT